MGAPTVNPDNIFTKIKNSFDIIAFSHSIEFYIPTLATTLATFGLFSVLIKSDEPEINTVEAMLLLSVIISLLGTAWIQYVVYKKIDDITYSNSRSTEDFSINKIILLSSIASSLVTATIAFLVFEYLKNIMPISDQLIFSNIVLSVFYSATWIQLSAIWSSGHHRYPAVLFLIAYAIVLVVSYFFSTIEIEFLIWGFVIGATFLWFFLFRTTRNLFFTLNKTASLLKTASAIWQMSLKTGYGMVFQTLIILALFLDKIIIWINEGAITGAGLQIISPYTTGSFLGFIPTISLIASVYFTERIKTISQEMYNGTLQDIRLKITQYKNLYWGGLFSMLTLGILVLIGTLIAAAYLIDSSTIIYTAATVGGGILLFQTIVANASVLSIFNKNHISVIAISTMCLCEIISIFFVHYNVWFAAAGFFVGSLIGMIISLVYTERLISKFEYNAYRWFQTAS